jgi:MFS family permease
MNEQSLSGRLGGARLVPWLALLLLLMMGLYTYMDRPLMTLLTEDMRRALGMSDFQIGLVQGLSFALLAALASYPIAWAADRLDRRWVIAGSLFVWAVAIFLCAIAGSFTELFLASALVGVGEAGLLPITYALIPELFKGQARVLANSLVILFGRVGSGAVFAIVGVLAAKAHSAQQWLPDSLASLDSWRIALILLAIPGPFLALAALGLPIRGRPLEAEDQRSGNKAPIISYLRVHWPAYGSFTLGIGLLVFAMTSLMSFLPVAAMRQMGASQSFVANAMALATIIGMGLAFVLVLGISALLKRRAPAREPIILPLVASGGCLLIAPFILLASTPLQLFIALGGIFLCFSIGAMSFPNVLQELTPVDGRARLISLVIMGNFGMTAIAQPIAGLLSDALDKGGGKLLIASIAVAAIALVLSVVSLAFCARRYAACVKAVQS